MKHGVMALLLAGLALPAGATIGVTRAGPSLRSFPQDLDMTQTVRKILESVDPHNDITVVIEPGAKGCAYATLDSDGRQYVVVDPVCVGPLRSGSAYNWRAVGILCHEVAHLISVHVMDRFHGPDGEAFADEWAGWQQANFGATLEEAQTYARTMPVNGSKTHPPRDIRLAAVARGWHLAQERLRSLPPVVCSTAPPPQEQRPREPTSKPAPQRGWWEELMTMPMPWAK